MIDEPKECSHDTLKVEAVVERGTSPALTGVVFIHCAKCGKSWPIIRAPLDMKWPP